MSAGVAEPWMPGGAQSAPASRRPVLGLLARRRAAKAVRRQRLVVVGNGMVGERFCERLVELDAQQRYEIVVLSEEALPAYDRVHLSDVLRGKSPGELVLRKFAWYTQHGIVLCLRQRMVSLDRAARRVLTSDGTSIGYDQLVLATGSNAVKPRIAMAEGANVLLYRTAADVETIQKSVQNSSRDLPALVIGAGLLGLEAARAIQLLGHRVVVFESSSQLLPRQLDNEAASVLQSTLVEAGIELRTRAAIERIEPAGDGLAIVLKDGEVFRAGVVVAAVGARANDEAARDAGLRCHPRGGVEVDTYLRTSDPHVFAIGECGSHQAVPHGLVAPGYVMANILAERLMGQRGKLEPQSAVTRLKLDLTEVTVVGDPIGVRPDRELVFRNKGVYRRLSFKKNRIVAAICIGTWKELAEVQTAAAAGHKIPKQARALFESEGNLGLAKADAGVASWPDDAIVCQCAFVTCGALRKAALTCPDVDALARATGASSLCGSCRPLLVTVSGTARTAPPDRRARLFTAAAIAALGLCALTLLMPRVPVATSISQQGLARLWIEPLFKQVSGLVLVSVVLVGLLFSLRKRVERFRLSSYKSLRVLHAALGALALIGLFAHTGFRLGQNLNLALTVVFLVSALSGALAGVSKALIPEQRKNLKLAAGYVERAHEITFWALPALVLFHALKTYYF